jgi:sulfur relay (sulfurtransferase) complex TusBCD TusD component (DsrE family)
MSHVSSAAFAQAQLRPGSASVQVCSPYFTRRGAVTEAQKGLTAKRMESRITDQGIKELYYHYILKKFLKIKAINRLTI